METRLQLAAIALSLTHHQQGSTVILAGGVGLVGPVGVDVHVPPLGRRSAEQPKPAGRADLPSGFFTDPSAHRRSSPSERAPLFTAVIVA